MEEIGKISAVPHREIANPLLSFEAVAPLADYYDSGWVADSITGGNHVTRFAHNFGNPPRIHQVFFSPGPDVSAVYPITWPWGTTSGNPVTVELTTQHVNLHIFAGSPLHGMWDGQSGIWRTFANGYWRVLAWR